MTTEHGNGGGVNILEPRMQSYDSPGALLADRDEPVLHDARDNPARARVHRRTVKALRVLERMSGYLLIVGLLGLWEWAVVSGVVDSPSIPSVGEILSAWWEIITSGRLMEELAPSLERILTGYLLAALVAIPVGAAMGSSHAIYRLLEPITELLRPVPSAAYIPVAILLLGIGDSMKITVVFIAAVFPILLNTYGGVRGCDAVLVDTGRTFGFGAMARLRKIVLPSALPEILTGMRISLGIALIVGVVAEMLAGNDGIGYMILESQRVFRVAQMFAGIFTLAVVGYLLNFMFVRFEARVLRWRQTGE